MLAALYILKVMSVPEKIWRFPTNEAISKLVERFNFKYSSDMQDWEWEVSDSGRIDEFVNAYVGGELSEDERFVLMETIIQSFEDMCTSLEDDVRWSRVLQLLEQNLDTHIYSVWYWSALEDEDLEESFYVAPFMRRLVNKHGHKYV